MTMNILVPRKKSSDPKVAAEQLRQDNGNLCE